MKPFHDVKLSTFGLDAEVSAMLWSLALRAPERFFWPVSDADVAAELQSCHHSGERSVKSG